MEGYQTLRQLGFGLLDMAYHIRSEEVKDIKAFEDAQTKAAQLEVMLRAIYLCRDGAEGAGCRLCLF
ncbi:hypothetical protein FQR65_LT19001 [Abscondita terminalis]|nr:hypothetical protein FQR65_LT19001 [Abscondita terminalis]